jgi:hypothetical protein
MISVSQVILESVAYLVPATLENLIGSVIFSFSKCPFMVNRNKNLQETTVNPL